MHKARGRLLAFSVIILLLQDDALQPKQQVDSLLCLDPLLLPLRLARVQLISKILPQSPFKFGTVFPCILPSLGTVGE
jgi:hypothetical protein